MSTVSTVLSTTTRSAWASSPTTRTEPLITAVVYGDSLGSNSRTYGSSDVSWKRNVISASRCGVSAIRPVPVTARRGVAARRQIRNAETDIVAGNVERAAARGRELRRAGHLDAWVLYEGDLIHGYA